jgi:hypothetical protein
MKFASHVAAPGNVTQDVRADVATRWFHQHEFVVGQTLYQYDFLNRTSETIRPAAASVNRSRRRDSRRRCNMSSSPTINEWPAHLRQRQIHRDVIGARRLLTDWDNTLRWRSQAKSTTRTAGRASRLLAIHNRALTPEHQTELDVGVGEVFPFVQREQCGSARCVRRFRSEPVRLVQLSVPGAVLVLLDGTAKPGSIPMARYPRQHQRAKRLSVRRSRTSTRRSPMRDSVEGRQYLSSSAPLSPRKRSCERRVLPDVRKTQQLDERGR